MAQDVMAGEHDWSQHAPLPDSTRVRVKPQLGDSYVITLGEACDRWRDARLFAIDWSLRTKGQWISQGLTIALAEEDE